VTDANIQKLQSENETLKAEFVNFRKYLALNSNEIDSLKIALMCTNQNIAAIGDSLKINISTTQSELHASSDRLSQSIQYKSKIGFVIFIVIAFVLIVFWKLIAKRRNEVANLSSKAEKLNEEIVNRLSTEVSEIQTLSKQISLLSTFAEAYSSDSEKKLIMTIADRITFMEMTLFKMDSSVRGYKQLSKSIKQMKDNLLSNGYELVDMLGKDYHEGMKVTASFVEDEDLPSGKQVITGVIKPQINFNGKMIQSAQITVSQNV
jgi:hypothetical protein